MSELFRRAEFVFIVRQLRNALIRSFSLVSSILEQLHTVPSPSVSRSLPLALVILFWLGLATSYRPQSPITISFTAKDVSLKNRDLS